MNLSYLAHVIGDLTEKDTYQKVIVETPDGIQMQGVGLVQKTDGTWVVTTKYPTPDDGFLEDDEEDVESTRPSGEFLIVQKPPPSIPIDEDMAHIIMGSIVMADEQFPRTFVKDKVDDDAKARLVRVLRAVHPTVVKQYEGAS
jgi:hypothetical protein